MVNIEYIHDENDELLKYLYNRETFNIHLSEIISGQLGTYTLHFSNPDPHKGMPYYDVYISPCWLDRSELKKLVYFLGIILEDWTVYCSISDHDDDELIELANYSIEKLSLLHNTESMPNLEFRYNAKISETTFDVLDRFINEDELIRWKKTATKKYLMKIGKMNGIR